MAIKIRINIGIIVHNNSIKCPSKRNRLIIRLFIIKIMMERMSMVIKIKIIIEKSWKKIIIS